MSYNYITDLNTNAIYKTTSREGAELIHRYMNQVGGQTGSGKNSRTILLQLIHEIKDPLSHEVTRKRLIENIDRLPYGGKTPASTLNRELCALRDVGEIEFIARGVYKTMTKGGEETPPPMISDSDSDSDSGSGSGSDSDSDSDSDSSGEETPPPMIEVHPQIISDIAKEIQVLSGLFGYGTLPEIQKRLSLLHEMMCSNIESLKCLQTPM